MNHNRLYLLSCLLMMAVAVSAQPSRQQMGGVYYAYPTPKENLADVPSDCRPVFILHYGRHGSRWLPSDSRYEWVMGHFDDTNALTTEGKRMRRLLRKVWKNARGNGGQLTPLGARQHREIAERMVYRFAPVFDAPGASVRARSSVVNRCRESMAHFTDRMHALRPTLPIDVRTDSADMAYIAYTSPELKRLEQKAFPKMKGSPRRFVQALFRQPETVKEPERLLSEIHTIASDMQDIPLSIDLYRWFTDGEFSDVYECNNERMVYCNADTPRGEGIPPLSALSLWQEMRACADSALQSDARGASLRFGHDTNLYRLLALMDVSGLDSGRMDEILPMAANLQMVLYRDGAGRALVRFLHNERDVSIPIRPANGVLYAWDDVCRYMEQRIDRLQHVRHLCTLNTMVGTAQANTETAGIFGKGSEEHGQTLPAVLTPNGQNFWTPQTRDTERKCIAPFYYADSLMQGIRCSHWLVGGCTQDYGSFTVAALGKSLRRQPEQRATRFDHDHEISHPHYYKVSLPQENLDVELTASPHGAIMRVTPLVDQMVHIVLSPNSDEAEGYADIDTLQRVVYASNPVHRIYQGWGERAGFSGHLMLCYDEPAVATEVFTDSTAFTDRLTIDHQPRIGACLSFHGQAGRPIVLRMASSFTGRDGCMANFKAEVAGKSFEQMMEETEQAWVDRLHTIDVESPDTAQVRQFYGALYRASFLPRLLSDVDGAYPRFASGLKMNGNRRVYTDFSMWDTYRALHPLCNIIAPDLSADMMQSLVNMYEEGGWMPIFPCWNSYTAAMIGDHCSVALADAYAKGVRNFDAQKAYEGMRRNAMESPASFEDYKNGMGRRALTSYLRYGYVPVEDSVKEAFHTQEQTSRTLEYAFDDFAVATMARLLGKADDYSLLARRADNWRNVINPRTGYADGRHADGRFVGNTDHTHRKPFITEGATCHYTWYVPHQPQALIQTLGGRQRFAEKLDSMFTEGRYWHGNEPCHQVPFLFNEAGQPRKTQQWVRHILRTEYNDTPGGLSGNDDAGQMSAWYVFAAMGFYPMCPASTEYQLASPTFRRVRIQQKEGRSFTIDAPLADDDRIYVERATLDGVPLEKPVFDHADIVEGKTLHVDMTR